MSRTLPIWGRAPRLLARDCCASLGLAALRDRTPARGPATRRNTRKIGTFAAIPAKRPRGPRLHRDQGTAPEEMHYEHAGETTEDRDGAAAGADHHAAHRARHLGD